MKIKECPFCGNEVKCEKGQDLNDNIKYIIYCDNSKCQIKPFTDMYKYKATVINHWNIRKGVK